MLNTIKEYLEYETGVKWDNESIKQFMKLVENYIDNDYTTLEYIESEVYLFENQTEFLKWYYEDEEVNEIINDLQNYKAIDDFARNQMTDGTEKMPNGVIVRCPE